MRNKGIKQKIIAVALCIVMLLGMLHIENFINNDISAAGDSSMEDIEFGGGGVASTTDWSYNIITRYIIVEWNGNTIRIDENDPYGCFVTKDTYMKVSESNINGYLIDILGWQLEPYQTVTWRSDAEIRFSFKNTGGYKLISGGPKEIKEDNYGFRTTYDSIAEMESYNGKSVSVPAGIQAVDYESDGGGFYFILEDSNGVKGFFSHSFGFAGHLDAIEENGYYVLPDPIPKWGDTGDSDPEQVLPESTGEEVFRSKLWIDPAINNSIDSNGKGVIGNWNGYTSKTGFCGGNSTADETKKLYEKIPESQFVGYTDWHEDLHVWEEAPQTKYTGPTYYPQETDPETGELLPLEIKTEGYYEHWGTYYTWSEDFCGPATEHKIVDPSIDNYTLTLHYQGGYFDGVGDTWSMNGFTNTKKFEDARQEMVVEDIVTSETTNVYCSAKTLKGLGTWNSSTNKYTHPANDYAEATITFSYSNYYVVSLPTPEREGFRFLGWYDAPSGGNRIYSTTVSPDGNTFTNAYVLTPDNTTNGVKTLYAQWELITKDETFTIYWLDNNNHYTTRPEAVYVELWRISEDESELCEGYITEGLNKTSAGYIQNFYNSTKDEQTNDIFDPNIYLDSSGTLNSNNNIFEYNGNYLIKITGDNLVPADSNAWTVTLENLQMYDTTKEGNIEYKYVIREIIIESLDETTQYYVSSNILHNNYTTSMNKYYNINNNYNNVYSEQGTKNDYESCKITEYFSKVVVNRLGNHSDPLNWKEITITTTFEDGPNNGITNDDTYHFRPYDLKLELYQNYSYGINKSFNNGMYSEGVRVIYDDPNTEKIEGEGYITQFLNPLSSTIPSSGTMANSLVYTFYNVPTLQDQTCVKLAYDVILTHKQSRYRYTIDSSDPYNNLDSKYESSHYFANKHATITNTVLNLDYTKMIKDGTVINITPDKAEYYLNLGYVFVDADLSNIFQNYQKQEDDSLYLVGQNNIYTNLGSAIGTKTYSDKYKSMAYNLRYYYISENRYMNSKIDYSILPLDMTTNKQTAYLLYTETLFWNFTLTLNHEDTPLPDEYTGSASSDDRTGNYTGSENDDFTHTNNKIIISNNVYNDDKQSVLATDENYDNLLMDISQEGFLITFKQVEKIWNYSGHDVTEGYDTSKYSTNGWVAVDNINTINGSIIKFVSNNSNPSSMITVYDTTDITYVGNEYNIYVPANGSVVMDYLPDGKYEITCHYDIDFDNFNFSFKGTNGTAEFTKENGKCYLTLSSKDVYTEGNVKHAATIDYWRGYVNDENQIPSYGTIVKYSVWNEKHGGSLNGFNVETNKDEKNPDNFDQDYLEENYKSYE